MRGSGDVRCFDRTARLSDFATLPANREAFLDGLDRAKRPICRVLDVGGSGRAALTPATSDGQATVVAISADRQPEFDSDTVLGRGVELAERSSECGRCSPPR